MSADRRLPGTDPTGSASMPDLCSCITCGDEAVALKVLEVDDTGLALCEDEDGERTDIEVALIGAVGPGDSVLAHAGTAIAKLAAVAA